MAFNSAIFLDVLVVAIFIYFSANSARRGLVANAICLGRYVVSYFLAATFCEQFAEYIYKIFIKQNLTEFLAQKVEKIYNISLNWASLRGSLAVIEQKIPFLNLSNLHKNLGALTSENLPQVIVETMAYPVIKRMVGAVLFLVFLKILRIVTRQFARVAYHVNFIPLLGGFNRVLGGIFGLGEALIVVLVLVNLLGLLIVASGGNLMYLNYDVVTKSHLVKYFFEWHRNL